MRPLANHPTALEEIRCGTFTSSVFTTVSVADTLCHPQFCRVPTLCRFSKFLRKTRLYFEKLLAALLVQRNTCWPWRPARCYPMCSGMCGYSATLEYSLDLHCHSVGSSWHSQSTAYPFTPEHYVVFEVVVHRRANIDEEFARWAAAPERYFSSLTGTTPQNWL